MDLLWIDNETRSRRDVTVCGAYELAEDPELRLLCASYALNDEPVRTWHCSFAGGDPDAHEPVPADLLDAFEDPNVYIVAWNAAFERLTFNAVRKRYGLPELPIERFICAAALARAHNLPGALDTCTKEWLPADQAKLDGKPTSWMWRADIPLLATPEHKAAYRQGQVPYCERDVESMRYMWELMLPPTEQFLREYWASEYVNDAGIYMDLDLIDAAIQLAPEVDAEVRAELDDITGGAVKPRGPSFLKWLQAILPPDMTPLLFSAKKKKSGYGWITETRPSAGKDVRAKLLEAMETRDGMDDVRDALALYDEANRAAVKKYEAGRKRSNAAGLLRGMFMFNGASQTGRYSGSAVQLHNTARASFADPMAAIEVIRSADPDRIKAELDCTVNVALSKVVRPSLMPAPGKELVWSDWSAIEARVLPWLSGDPDAEEVLDVFRADGDLYISTAAKAFNMAEEDVDKETRQLGKVQVLSLGYAGGVGAFQNMARIYGVKVEDAHAREMVTAWRESNPWAPRFWSNMESAAFDAIRNPTVVYEAGRCNVVCVPGLLRDTLLVFMPCGRFLAYPEAHIAKVEKEWPDGRVSESDEIAFRHPAFGLSTTHGGKLCQGVSQGFAASLLRDCIVRLVDQGEEVLGHVHDEIFMQVPEGTGAAGAARLQAEMTRVPDFAEGLPLAAEAEYGPRYKVAVKG